ncbi:hypothetical protein [Leucobacter luti]|uniref:ABC-2 type transport system permease protein n=1 Tax=Leucobacter luti TaxID=340320 RepID=A0A4Q7U5F4_9MICO|nr:hypothetical protein [Leucobacter luti]MBL3700896.1 hypothetical protein [Leucobacter luti]RZT68886.1 hypothetical protein EV139_0617 [Leucobacter luti]
MTRSGGVARGGGKTRSRGGAAALRAVRAVRRARGDRLSAGEVSYRIYVAVMLLIIVVAPFVRTAILAAVPVLPDSALSFPAQFAAVLTLLVAGVVLLGGRGGPARAGLPQLDLLFPTAIPRWRLLAPPVLRWFGGGAAGGALLGGMVATVFALVGPLPWELAVATVAAGAGLGVLVVGALLLGQRGPRTRAVVAAVLAGLAAAQLSLGALWDPWSAAARLLETGAAVSLAGGPGGFEVVAVFVPGVWATMAIPLAAAVVALAGALPFAARLPRELLRAQAVNWDAASTLAVTGDPNAALARLGTPVRSGRRLRLRPAETVFGTLVRRDLLGLARAPGRSLAALVGVAAAGACWAAALAPGQGFVGAALLGAAATALASLSLQPWCRGIVTAASGAGSPPLLPLGPGGLILRHSAVPALAAGLAVCLGVLLAGAGAGAGMPLLALATGPVLAASVVLLRIAAALKGSIPLRLLAPVPTPAGDLASVNVFLWTIDGPVVSVLVGAVLGASWGWGAAAGGALIPVVVTVVTLIALAGWARSRLKPSLADA